MGGACSAGYFMKVPNLDGHHQDPTKGTIRLKHELLRKYLPPFAGMAGKTAMRREVHYFDGYAGAGTFADGSAAGAAHTLKMIAGLSDANRKLVCTYVEKDRNHFQRLKQLIEADEDAYPGVEVIKGSAERELPKAAARAQGQPFFCFLDPYGLNVDFEDLAEHVLSRPHRVGEATEVLLLYASEGVRRCAARLTEDPSKDPTVIRARESTLRTLDGFLGTSAWRDVWTSNAPREDREDAILDLYREQFSEYHFATVAVPMRDKPGEKAKYHLLFATRHPAGLWTFLDKLGHAHEVWCMEMGATSSQGNLFDGPDLSFDAPVRPEAADLVDAIEANLRRVVADKGEINPMKDVADLYGETVGVARSTHVRKALKRLHPDLLDENATGRKFYDRTYYRVD